VSACAELLIQHTVANPTASATSMLRTPDAWQVERPEHNRWLIQTAFVNTNLIIAWDIAWNT
jgi:hypothetical protein